MANRLKIYACSGIGSTSKNTYDYWTDNTNTINNTQAVNLLLSRINLLYSSVMYLEMSRAQLLECLNAIDLYVVCLDAAEKYANHYTKLEKAGQVIGTMLSQGQFSSGSLDNKERDLHLDELIGWFEDAMGKDGQYVLATDEFLNWWGNDIVALNKIGLSKEDRTIVEDTLHSTPVSVGDADINWESIPDLNKYLSDASEYFLYTYFTDEQIEKLPRLFKSKRRTQNDIYRYCKKLYTDANGREEAMQNIIRGKIIARYGATPEQVCDDIVNGRKKNSPVGSLTAAQIITIISTIVVPIVIAIITAICEVIKKKNSDKYAAIDQAALDGGIPSQYDFDDSEFYTGNSSTKAGFSLGGNFTYIAIAAIAALIFWKRN